MAFNVPTIQEIRDRIQSDIEQRFGGTIPNNRQTLLSVLIVALSGALYIIYKTIEQIALTIFPSTARGVDLDRIGQQYNIIRRTASFWEGTATSEDTMASLIIVGTRYRASDRKEYSVFSVSQSGADAVLSLRAIDPGATENRAVGEMLSIIVAIPNAPTTISVSAVTRTAVSAEGDDVYRSRILNTLRRRPQGGALSDYISWANEVSGVSRAWSYFNGLGHVLVVIEGTPATGQTRVAASTALAPTVRTYINAASRKPVGSVVEVRGVTETRINITITNLSDTSRNSALRTQIRDYFESLQVGMLDPALGVAENDQTALRSLITCIVVDYGDYDTVTMRAEGAAADTNRYVLGRGELVTIGTLLVNGSQVNA